MSDGYRDAMYLQNTILVPRVLDPEFLPGSGSKFLWIRVRFLNFSGDGSGFQISLDPGQKRVQKGL